MSSLIARWGSHLATLAASLVLCGCVITAAGTYFDAGDFDVPKVFTGDWASVPELSTHTTEDVTRLRFIPIEKSLHRAQPLLASGAVDTAEEPVDFGLVPLGGQHYILVNVEDEGDGKKSNFIGVDAQEGKLTLYLFDGGDSPASQAAFASALTRFGLERDMSMQYEARLAGAVTKDKIKSLFQLLLSAPVQYEPDVTIYKKMR